MTTPTIAEMYAANERLVLAMDSLDDYDRCSCRGLEEHAAQWPGCMKRRDV